MLWLSQTKRVEHYVRITGNAHEIHCKLPVTSSKAENYRYCAAALGITVTGQNPLMRTIYIEI